MSNRKKNIHYPKERAILADVLPFEVPITFSNRHFYKFLVKNRVELNYDKITYENNFRGDDKDAFEILFKILFSVKLDPPNFRKIPFTYRINHKENNFRELALVHPINQLMLIELYDKYKELIIYYCAISNFSIRKPTDIAKFTFFNDKLHQANKGDKSDFLELSGKEYENLKTFFSYKKYTNIYRFYEDYRYQRAEKKYNFLYTFDITKCFDSIYTHSLVWAVLGPETVKENVNDSKKTFAGFFDYFIQYANYGETNGILIGPEFSRIFAEIILQRIDYTIENKLKAEGSGFYFKKHYELYRYVDDYFLFCDDEQLKIKVLTLYKHELKKYKLSINDSKSKDYKKPIITGITIAKDKIVQLFLGEPNFKIERNDIVDNCEDGSPNESVLLFKKKFNFYFDSNKLATKYKIIIKESGIDYKDVLNYSLAILNTKIEKNLTSFENAYEEFVRLEIDKKLTKKDLVIKCNLEKSFTDHIEKFIDFVFFIYSVSPRVNSTIKVSHILSKIIKFFKGFYKFELDTQPQLVSRCSAVNKERIFKKILDESSLVLNKNTLNEYAQVESLYLLTVLRDLGKDFRLNQVILSKFLNVTEGNYKIKEGTLNYFSIVVAIFYIGKSEKYPDLKTSLLNYTLNYIESYPIEKRGKSAEIAHLVLDLFSCPFVNSRFKKKLLLLYRNSSTFSERRLTILDAEKIINFNKHQKYWFTKWERFDLAKELENKKSQEVYS
jgi:hypothetical protein